MDAAVITAVVPVRGLRVLTSAQPLATSSILMTLDRPPTMKQTNPGSITLTLTDACNLRCAYCYERHKSINRMSFETAKDILDRELGNTCMDFLTIDFFGGEPFLEFTTMKRVCEYVWSKEWDVEYRFFVSTNGTLVHGDIQKWLHEHRESFWVGLSFDGTPEMNDVNRDSSSDRIDLPFFASNWPTQGVKMTVSRETLPTLAAGVKYLHSMGFSVNCNLAYGPDWNSAQWDRVLQDQLMDLVDFYVDNPDITPCSMLSMEIPYVAVAHELEYTKWCGAGTSMKVYAPDGTCYPCHFFEPMAVGREMAVRSLSIDFTNAAQLQDPDCDGCVLLPICPTCYGSNYAATGDITKKDHDLCELTKTMAMANSYLWFRLLDRYSDEELGINRERRKLLTDGIIAIQKGFETDFKSAGEPIPAMLEEM